MSGLAQLVLAYKRALVTASQTAIADKSVLVRAGRPSPGRLPDDIVAWTRATSTSQQGPLSASNRSRDVDLVATAVVSVFRRGGAEQETVAEDRAYELLDLVEHQVRVADTTLGGLVWWCFCTSTDSDGASDPAVLSKGRVIEITAEFTASARISR